ncbi:hypothetical protein HYPGJ_31642 [Hyphomicrobium sp. GJ21]|nr:hypothetical protein HYPGJ_31642 [Hyphomicrobium sp. GJ21]
MRAFAFSPAAIRLNPYSQMALNKDYRPMPMTK